MDSCSLEGISLKQIGLGDFTSLHGCLFNGSWTTVRLELLSANEFVRLSMIHSCVFLLRVSLCRQHRPPRLPLPPNRFFTPFPLPRLHFFRVYKIRIQCIRSQLYSKKKQGLSPCVLLLFSIES